MQCVSYCYPCYTTVLSCWLSSGHCKLRPCNEALHLPCNVSLKAVVLLGFARRGLNNPATHTYFSLCSRKRWGRRRQRCSSTWRSSRGGRPKLQSSAWRTGCGVPWWSARRRRFKRWQKPGSKSGRQHWTKQPGSTGALSVSPDSAGGCAKGNNKKFTSVADLLGKDQ